jgi:hypothetical protein
MNLRTPGQSSTVPRLIRFLLRDGSRIEGKVYLSRGQALAPYLSSRKSGWVNMVDTEGVSPRDRLAYLALQSHHMLAAIPLEADVPVSGIGGITVTREVELRLERGRRLRGKLHLSQGQRLADYLHALGQFIPLAAAAFTDEPSEPADLVVNAQAVIGVTDITSVPEGH